MGNHHRKGDSECPLTDQRYRLEQWSIITLSMRKTYRDNINFGKKVLPGIFFGCVFYAGRLWKGDIVVADIAELEEMDASELHARRLNAKEVLTPMKGDTFIFPVADGTVKVSGGDQRLRTSTLIRDRPERGEEQEVFRGESDGLYSPHPLQDARDDAEAKNDFWSFAERFHLSPSCGPPSQTVQAKRRIISYSAKVHRRYPEIHIHRWMCCWRRNILKITGTMMEIESCQMHGQVSQDSLY